MQLKVDHHTDSLLRASYFVGHLVQFLCLFRILSFFIMHRYFGVWIHFLRYVGYKFYPAMIYIFMFSDFDVYSFGVPMSRLVGTRTMMYIYLRRILLFLSWELEMSLGSMLCLWSCMVGG